MLQFIFLNVLLIAVGTVLYLAVRALPRLEGENERRVPLLERFVMSDVPHKVDQVLNTYAGKLFRKLKVMSMKLDNFLTHKLKKMGPAANGKPKIDLKEIADEKNEGEG